MKNSYFKYTTFCDRTCGMWFTKIPFKKHGGPPISIFHQGLDFWRC
ncbi:hypothetical protein RintRC_6686 [Richelia intracellularis]|nr:hypothetical protein RintRC_6686 [Richelia intracellularis]